jgi:hypothetical protein
MQSANIFIGSASVQQNKKGVSGNFVELNGEKYYQIKNYNEMDDFFISIVSDSDHWMFISSNGALSAGRKNKDNALFPYYTDDKIHNHKGITGSRSYFLIEKENKTLLWEPFTDLSAQFYQVSRNIYKNIYGNKLLFEEVNHDLGLSFSYEWMNSEKFGFVKKSILKNIGSNDCSLKLLDGIKNIMPYGVGYYFQNEYSNLLDAYKKNELIEGTSLGLFMLSSIPVDKAEPSEALKTTAVWSIPPSNDSHILVSDHQVEAFKQGAEINSEKDIRASRGAYYIHAALKIEAQQEKEWMTIAEINQDTTQISNLRQLLLTSNNLASAVYSDIEKGTENLKQMVAYSDGFQVTNTPQCYVRHYSNTLFNIMRGGVFSNGYMLSTEDFKLYLKQINTYLYNEYQSWLERLPQQINYLNLLNNAKEFKNADLLRIVYEYLPLTFSRRHGDPSRPWNQFSIETKNEDGSPKLNYQGNWRDIFQNWEALSYSFPEYVEGIISKFVNASTIDGYNPYRIMREGIDWEAPDPEDPWAYIGYWGDHQIIYLQKLLEVSNQFHPGKLDELLAKEMFTYAHVPYEIKAYDQIVANPKDTVVFKHELHQKITEEAEHLGADAKLLKSAMGSQIYKVNLSEKILASLLSKLSNFIPDAGIWLNTQRPEWNDANNAMVGNGTSMVTLYYMRRFIKFWKESFKASKYESYSVSKEMKKLFKKINQVLSENKSVLENGFDDKNRKDFTDAMGWAHSDFRQEIYQKSFSGKKKDIATKDLEAFCDLCLQYIDSSIASNKRPDGLYHAYNLITFSEEGISIRNLYEMLEGQVAVLSSGYLSPQESLSVLDALKSSEIYRKDQFSYMLYPNRVLPRFEEKNNIPEALVAQSKLLQKLIQKKDVQIIQMDDNQACHFNGSFTNAEKLKDALEALDANEYNEYSEEEKNFILNIYEQIFDHKSFTGRSGTFYGYEGLGSIYWHMVSKLLLATQEAYTAAITQGADAGILGQLKAHYYEIKAGIGIYKSPDLYGAFPTDAYSHTPFGAGVKQPGLTGQVKEDVISRFGELGLSIYDGKINFNISLLNEEEILTQKQSFEYYSLDGNRHQLELKENQLAFTFCQVPFVYTFGDKTESIVHLENSQLISEDHTGLSKEHSQSIFSRKDEIKLVEITFNIK